MIEVRIPERDIVEFGTLEGANAYIHGKLVKAGVPLLPFEAPGAFLWNGPGTLSVIHGETSDTLIYLWERE
jgi:hypothetical protein